MTLSSVAIDGLALADAKLSPGECEQLAVLFDSVDGRPASLRLFSLDDELLDRLASVATGLIGLAARPVRALLLDKRPGANWNLGWHQDRTIAVHAQHDAEGFGPWTIKDGVPHVAPPIALLEQMVTLRVHVDAVDFDNAPLLVAAGSHRLGRIDEHLIDAVVAECGEHACLAERGAIWCYATLVLHRSARAARLRRRRVVQIDYCAQPLPLPLDWAWPLLEPGSALA